MTNLKIVKHHFFKCLIVTLVCFEISKASSGKFMMFRSLENCNKNFAIEGNITGLFKVTSQKECMLRCLSKRECSSVNIGGGEEENHLICELSGNHADSYCNKLTDRPGFSYLEKVSLAAKTLLKIPLI